MKISMNEKEDFGISSTNANRLMCYAHINRLWLIHNILAEIKMYIWYTPYKYKYKYNSMYNSIWLCCKKPVVWIYGIVTYIMQMLYGSKVNSPVYEPKTFRKYLLVSFCFYICGNYSTNVTSIDVHCRQNVLVCLPSICLELNLFPILRSNLKIWLFGESFTT